MNAAWLVHFYTAGGALCAFLALRAIIYDRYTEAFLWLGVALFIDATDGLLARRADVHTRTPQFNGAKLDDIVDYLTYVFIPAYFVWHALLLPDSWSIAVVAAMLLSSAYGFNREDAKTEDHYFTGFPSYWNIVVFYLWIAGMPVWMNGAILLSLAALVFVPIRYVYPSRTSVFPVLTNVLGAIWGLLMLVMLWQAPDVMPAVFWASLIFPAYYVWLSLALEFKRRKAAQSR